MREIVGTHKSTLRKPTVLTAAKARKIICDNRTHMLHQGRILNVNLILVVSLVLNCDVNHIVTLQVPLFADGAPLDEAEVSYQ